MINSTPIKKTSGGSEAENALKPRVVAIVLGTVLLLFALVGWHLFSAASHPARPDMPVHPGMYNLRQELQKGMGAKPNGPDTGEKRSAP